MFPHNVTDIFYVQDMSSYFMVRDVSYMFIYVYIRSLRPGIFQKKGPYLLQQGQFNARIKTSMYCKLSLFFMKILIKI